MAIAGTRTHAGIWKNWLLRIDQRPRWRGVRRRLRSPLYRFVDTGFLNLTPLQMHIVICGFPAAGTTLMQLMIENGLPTARRFGKERSGWRAATYSWRNHELLVSKQPRDLLTLDVLREFYGDRAASLRTIIMVRDPRDLMTSQRKRGSTVDYCGCVAIWQEYYLHFHQQCDRDDTLVVRFEDLVADPEREQQRVEAFTGQAMAVPFRSSVEVERADFDTTHLCGLRPLDSSRISRWRDPIHRPRLQQVLRDLPELPQIVRRLGYEQDDRWVEQVMDSPAVETAPQAERAGVGVGV